MVAKSIKSQRDFKVITPKTGSAIQDLQIQIDVLEAKLANRRELMELMTTNNFLIERLFASQKEQ